MNPVIYLITAYREMWVQVPGAVLLLALACLLWGGVLGWRLSRWDLTAKNSGASEHLVLPT